MLELRELSWSPPEGGDLIKNLNLNLHEGRLTVITGPNGGGKTTLAKLIAGLIEPNSGQILFDQEDITHYSITQRALCGISYGFQQPVRFKGILVRDLLNIAAKRELDFDELCELMGKVGLCTMDYIDREVNASLSGGEIKRIEIASVLARNTKLMIFDEPEAGIDMWSFQGLVKVFGDLKAAGKSMIIISHQSRIIDLADEIVVLAGGKVRDHGPKDRILPSLLEGEITGHCPVKQMRDNK